MDFIYSQEHLKTITYGILFEEGGGWSGRGQTGFIRGIHKYIHLTSENVLFMKRIVQRKGTDYFYCKSNKLEL